MLAQCGALIWDEVGTASAAALDAADACVQDLLQNDQPFGGALVVLGGDLRQTLPVLEHAGRVEIVASAGAVMRFSLSRNQRAATDPTYRDFLLRIGEGRLPFGTDVGPHSVHLPPEICFPADATTDALVACVYDNLSDLTQQCLQAPTDENLTALAARCILTPRNDWVAALNDRILGAFFSPTSIVELRGSTTLSGGTAEDYASYPAEHQHSLDVPGLPPTTLRLCPGALVMLL